MIEQSATLDDTFFVAGYASLFNEQDLSGDIVRPGAFASALLSRESTAFPMLYGHDTTDPIGVWNTVFEDQTGLFVAGDILPGTAIADRVIRLVKRGALSGLSIGYRTLRSRKSAQGRELLELDLWEVSIVAFPMLRSARLTQTDDHPQEISRRSYM